MVLSIKGKIDYFIVFAVSVQSVLILLQTIMIDVIGMEPEQTTTYRVILSAVMMLIAIFFSFRRSPVMFICVYGVAITILSVNVVVFPENSEYLIRESVRFLLPVVIPSALCLTTVKNLEFIEKVWYHISWIVFVEILIYVVSYYMKIFTIEDYNMSFSYGCLLPMIVLYRRKNKFSVIASFIIFLVIMLIGSRGAVIIYVTYLLFDVFQNNRRMVMPLVILCLIMFSILPIFVSYLEINGFSSRTISHIESGDLFRYNDRDALNKHSIDVILDNPFGIGLYGDRSLFNGSYCHNIIIELILNWGILLGFIIVIVFLITLINVYFKVDKINKNKLVFYLMVFIIPLMFSGSYLISSNFGMFCGLFYLLSRQYS